MSTHTPLATILIQSLRDRTAAFVDYVTALQRDMPASHKTARRAMGLFADYTTALIPTVENAIAKAPGGRQQEHVARTYLQHLTYRQRIFDDAFSRSTSGLRSTSLELAIERELEALGLENLEPVVRVGAPGNFSMLPQKLNELLFDDLLEPPELVGKTPALLIVPAVEGARALWQPVVVGHELAHFRLSPDATSRHARAMALACSAAEDDQDRERLAHSLGLWMDEILCDLNAVRRYGPAGAAALIEMLEVTGAQDGHLTHPPTGFRAKVMVDALGDLAPCYRRMLAPWMAVSGESVWSSEPLTKRLISLLEDHVGDLVKEVWQWGPAYDHIGRSELVAHVVDRFGQRLPAILSEEEVTRRDILEEDILNAGWLSLFDTPDAGHADGIEWSCSRALNDIDRISLTPASESAAQVPRLPDATPTGGGQLVVGQELLRRLEYGRHGYLQTGLLVAPWSGGLLRGYTLRLRLSNVFQRLRPIPGVVFSVEKEEQGEHDFETLEAFWNEALLLPPGQCVLASTIEMVRMPPDLCALLQTPSSYARLGIIAATAQVLSPSFSDYIAVEICNVGDHTVELRPGTPLVEVSILRASGVEPVAHEPFLIVEPSPTINNWQR